MSAHGRPRPRARPLLTLLLLTTACGPATSREARGPTPATADRPDSQLQHQLEAAVQGFHGGLGVYVYHLRTGATAAIAADDTFPTASMIKVPIMVGVFDAITRGRFRFTDTAPEPRARAKYPEDDISAGLSDTARITVSRLLTLSLTYSDNSASLWLQQLAGAGTAINDWLGGHGFAVTRVNARTAGRDAEYDRWGWGQTTPREMARLVTLIRQGQVVSPAASEEMYRTLTRSFWTGEALSQLPPTVQAASKQGAVDESRSEVVLVNAPSGDYVFCVITKNQQDESQGHDNEGYLLLRKVSALLWRYFEPNHPWRPAPGAEQFKP
ncbi:MAG TPA: serine hydrolase [Gemmatimonadales bacterium]|nr:serine hydrolase [Gemmatimonadales bacterium]